MFKRRVLLSLFLFLVFIAVSEQFTLRLQSSDESNELKQISKREAEQSEEENVSEEETTANVEEAGAKEETPVPEEQTQPSEDANDSAEKAQEEETTVETNAEETTSQEAVVEEESPAVDETKSEEAQAEENTAPDAEVADGQSETSTEAQIEAPANVETQAETADAESSAESLTKDSETVQAQSEEKLADVVPETAAAALAEASGQNGASQEASSDDGSGQEEEQVISETTTDVDQIVISPEDNLPTDGVEEYRKENNVTLPADTEGSGSSEYEENKDFDPKGKGGELPPVSGEDDDGSGDEDTHEPVTTEKPTKDFDDDDDIDEEEKKNVWFKPSGEFTVAENDRYLENIKKCPSLQCEYGFRIDWDDRPNCDCYNPCNEVNCGSDVCIVEQTVNNRFKGVCHTKETIDQKVKDGKPLHCHKPRPKPEVCRKKHYTSRFFYNISASRCEHFIYTSCAAEPDANKYDNHFLTWETCQMECHTCNLPAERGPCKANVLRYFYDPASKECKGFSWGGCQGNENNFATRRHCEDSCVRRVEGALFLNGMPVRKIRIYNSGGDIFNKN